MNDLLGKKCNLCTGEYTKMGLDDDLCGCVTCCECGNRVNRYIVTNLRPANNIDLSFEISDKETTTKKNMNWVYSRYDCDKCNYEGCVPCPDHHPEPCEKKESEETLTAKIDVLTEVIERIEKFEMPEQPLQERSDYYRDIVGNMLADCKVKLIEL